ncbi:MAG: SPFH domain-containing protein [Candidatus Aureabacteria bacterium]|nr:SPFH domain-containing protein [Candidatus Auribacterota bacterium]
MNAIPSGGSATAGLFLTIIFALIVIIILTTILRRYKRCPSNKILVIYGKTAGGASKCIHGGAAFIWPLIQSYDYLDLEPFVVPIDLSNALSQENIRVSVPTTVTAAVSNQAGIMQNAAIRLLGLTTQQIQTLSQDIIIGQMRAIIATMRIVDINRDRQAFMAKVNEAVAVELEKIGLALINVNIRDLDDESGYIKAIGRQAASEAVNQANIDVAEQDKLGQMGVATRQRDQRIAVAAAMADAQVGEANADRSKRQQVAKLDAEAVQSETVANANKASYHANQKVAEEEARNRGESAAREATGAIRVAQEIAEKKAEDARSIREQSRLNAEVVVPADAAKKRLIIESEAQRDQAVLIARGQADALLAKMTAEGKGIQAVLDGKAEGYRNLVESAGDPQVAASLLLIEKLVEISHIQAQAIQDLPLQKIIVWDGGGESGGMSNLGKKLMGVLPPMHELAKQVGLDMPEFLGKLTEEAKKSSPPSSPKGKAEGAK